MISRKWKGLAYKENKEDYINHLENNVFPKLKENDGFVSCSIQYREVGEGLEFLVISVWKSIDHIKAFTGEDISIAYVPREIREWFIWWDQHVAHFTIHESS